MERDATIITGACFCPRNFGRLRPDITAMTVELREIMPED